MVMSGWLLLGPPSDGFAINHSHSGTRRLLELEHGQGGKIVVSFGDALRTQWVAGQLAVITASGKNSRLIALAQPSAESAPYATTGTVVTDRLSLPVTSLRQHEGALLLAAGPETNTGVVHAELSRLTAIALIVDGKTIRLQDKANALGRWPEFTIGNDVQLAAIARTISEQVAGPIEFDYLDSKVPDRPVPRIDVALYAEARQKLAADQPLSSEEAAAFLDGVLMADRLARGAEVLDRSSSTALHEIWPTETCYAGCGTSWRRLSAAFSTVDLDVIQLTNRRAYSSSSSFQAGTDTVSHVFGAVSMPTAPATWHLLDNSFGQFRQLNDSRRRIVFERLLQRSGGLRVLSELTLRGHIQLTDEITTAYGHAISGRNRDFSVEDFQ